MSDKLQIAQKVFGEIKEKFPKISMHINSDPHPSMELLMDIPKQEALNFKISLYLSGDELHINTRSLWLELFPCTDPYVVEKYMDAVTGLLSGEYRILEHYYGEKAIKAQLQAPHGNKWKTIGTWSKLGLYLPWGRTTKILQNK